MDSIQHDDAWWNLSGDGRSVVRWDDEAQDWVPWKAGETGPTPPQELLRRAMPPPPPAAKPIKLPQESPSAYLPPPPAAAPTRKGAFGTVFTGSMGCLAAIAAVIVGFIVLVVIVALFGSA